MAAPAQPILANCSWRPCQRAGDVVAAVCGGWLKQLPQDFEDFLLREMIPAVEEFSRVFGQCEPW